MAVIIHDGMKRMVQNQENVFYYITAMNENYVQPAMPEGAEEGIVKGMHLIRKADVEKKDAPRAQLLGSGTILEKRCAARAVARQRHYPA
jgi:pyruvate dehydrogenase E1 component